jgi:hypothetical protein
MVSQITHGNGVTETQGNDPNQMRRPSSLSASGPYANWSSGTYGYDGAGNIKAIGAFGTLTTRTLGLLETLCAFTEGVRVP